MQQILDMAGALSAPTWLLIAYGAVWLLAMLRCLAFSRVGQLVASSQPGGAAPLPALSVVVLCTSDADLLRRRLALFLEQDHPSFELILVLEGALDAEADHWLSDLEYAHPRLRHLLLPQQAQCISRQAMALSLGMRAAHHDWVLFTALDCVPATSSWLSAMASHATGERDIIVGYHRFAPARGVAQRRLQFASLWQQLLLLSWGNAHKLLSAPVGNVLFRRSYLRQQGGFAEGANLKMGAMEMAVNRLGNKRNVALCLLPEARVERDMPLTSIARKAYRQRQCFLRRRMRQAWWHSLRSLLHGSLTWLLTLALMACVVGFLLSPASHWAHWLVLAMLWLAHALWRDKQFNVSASALALPPYHLTLPLYLHALPLWQLSERLRYRFSSKRKYYKDFV